MPEDVKGLQRSLKEMELRAKLGAKAEKRRLKEEKIKMKLKKKQDKMRKKMVKKGQLSNEEAAQMELRESQETKEKGKVTSTPSDQIVKAEIVEFKAEEWSRRSVHSMDEVEKKIDRFSGKGVKGLSQRYRERYGEELKIPELYQIESSLEDDLDSEVSRKEDEAGVVKFNVESKEDTGKGFFGKKRKKERDAVEDYDLPELSFWDMGTGVLFLRKKYGEDAGGAKRGLLVFVDILLLVGSIIAFPIIIIRLIITMRNSRRRKKSKLNLDKTADSAKAVEA